jgi:hypothetical protein
MQNAGSEQEKAGEGSRRIIFYPNSKPGVNDALRQMFAAAHITVIREVCDGMGTVPQILADGEIYRGLRRIGDYVRPDLSDRRRKYEGAYMVELTLDHDPEFLPFGLKVVGHTVHIERGAVVHNGKSLECCFHDTPTGVKAVAFGRDNRWVAAIRDESGKLIWSRVKES